MAIRIGQDDRISYARKIIGAGEAYATTPGLRNQMIGMKRILRVFEGEHDEEIKVDLADQVKATKAEENLFEELGGGSDE